MKPILRLKHERDYYLGLGFLLASCLSLLWALWRDAFRPNVFLAGFLLFSWGYALLWRHDLKQQLAALTAELAELKSCRPRMEDVEIISASWAQELPAAGEPGDDGASTGQEILAPSEF
ncbi:MAG: hypothetical protein ACM3X6_11695 [Patescibacteria group bacterium]